MRSWLHRVTGAGRVFSSSFGPALRRCPSDLSTRLKGLLGMAFGPEGSGSKHRDPTSLPLDAQAKNYSIVGFSRSQLVPRAVTRRAYASMASVLSVCDLSGYRSAVFGAAGGVLIAIPMLALIVLMGIHDPGVVMAQEEDDDEVIYGCWEYYPRASYGYSFPEVTATTTNPGRVWFRVIAEYGYYYGVHQCSDEGPTFSSVRNPTVTFSTYSGATTTVPMRGYSNCMSGCYTNSL